MRIILEVLGSTLLLAAQVVLLLLYYLGISVLPGVYHGDTLPAYLATIVLGYLLCIGVLRFAEGRGGALLTRRMRFDCFLLALPVAFLSTVGLMALNQPIQLKGWNAHGFGVGGGAVNVIFFPWLHGLLTLTIVKVRRRWE